MKNNYTNSNSTFIPCDKCALSLLCNPLVIGDTEVDVLSPIINRCQFVKRGDFLYRKGDKFHSNIAIAQGSVKLSISNQAQEQIMGFRLIGEIVGMSGMHNGKYLTDAQLLENSHICEIPFEMLDNLANNVPQLQRKFRQLLSQLLVCGQYQSVSLGKKTADERLASFLLNLSYRFNQRGYSANSYILAMTRNDIANYLGLTKETISRLFKKFHEKGLLLIQKKHVQIANIDLLKTVAGINH